ncbi:MAG: M24 family metallopeptidase [Flavonifractor plautii]
MNQARLARVLRNMERDGLTQIVISSTASVYYLTGYWVEPMERMLALYIRADGTCRLFANALFALEPQEGLELVLHQDSDVPTAALAAALLPGTLGVDKAWPSKFLIALLAARPDVTPVLGSAPVDDARKYKDADEIAAMRRASQINDQVVEAAIAAVRPARWRVSWPPMWRPLPAARPDRSGEGQLVASAPTEPTPPRPQRDGAPDGDSVVLDIFIPSSATGAT